MKQVKKKYCKCPTCIDGLQKSSDFILPEEQLVELKTHGGLIHSSKQFFHLIMETEKCLQKHKASKSPFSSTIDDILEKPQAFFNFPCPDHAAEILSYSICYYVRMRIFQLTKQWNAEKPKKFTKIKKNSKFAET